MLDEYALVPDVFERAAYSNPAYIEMCLPHLKELLFEEALVRDLYDGGWSAYCLANVGSLHRLCKEIVRKLVQKNRLHRFPRQNGTAPATYLDWCQEALATHDIEPLRGIIAAHATKQQISDPKVASIEKLTGTNWWQARSPSLTVDRKTEDYLRVLGLILKQANSLMFIDPNLDPSSYNYREFALLLTPLAQRWPRPRIEIHRSFCKGDGPARTFPSQADWKSAFYLLGDQLAAQGLSAEVFFWDDFHDRYLITDVIGISVPAGFDISAKPNDLTTWGRLGREDKEEIQRRCDPAARQGHLRWRFVIGECNG